MTFDNLLQLARLPWFVEGRIPDAARSLLLDYLPKSVETEVRSHLQELFIKLPKPPAESAAAEDYTVTQLTNTLHLQPDSRDTEQELAYYLAAGAEPDLTTIRYLDRPKNRLDFIVPDGLKKYAFHEGRPFFGWRAWAWALPLWLVLSGFIAFFDPNFEACDGDVVQFENLQLCLETQEDWLRYYDHLSRRRVEQQQHEAVDAINVSVDSVARVLSPGGTDSLVQSLNIPQQNRQQQRPFGDSRQEILQAKNALLQALRTPQVSDLETSAYEKYYHNLATAYYNSGVLAYNLYKEKLKQLDEEFGDNRFRQMVQPSTTAQQELEQEVLGLQDSSCYLFQRACQFYQKDVDIVDMALWCSTPQDIYSPDIPSNIRGGVRDAESGNVVVNAQLFNKTLGTVETNTDGQFYFPQPDSPLTTFRLQVTRLGYDTAFALVTSGSAATIRLTPNVAQLPRISGSRELSRTGFEPSKPSAENEQLTYDVFYNDASNALFGLRRSDGRVLLQPRYDLIVRDDETGWYRAMQGDEYGFYDAVNGRFAIPMGYDGLLPFSEGLVAAQGGDKWGYLNRSGNIAIDFQFDEAKSFRQNEAAVKDFSKTRASFFINKQGECVRNCPEPEQSQPETTPQQSGDFIDRTVKLSVESRNLPEGASKVRLQPATVSVTLRVPLELYKDFNAQEEVTAVVDFASVGINSEEVGKTIRTPTIAVEVASQNQAVLVASYSPRTVEYYLIR